jgi:hypothetical protein
LAERKERKKKSEKKPTRREKEGYMRESEIAELVERRKMITIDQE